MNINDFLRFVNRAKANNRVASTRCTLPSYKALLAFHIKMSNQHQAAIKEMRADVDLSADSMNMQELEQILQQHWELMHVGNQVYNAKPNHYADKLFRELIVTLVSDAQLNELYLKLSLNHSSYPTSTVANNEPHPDLKDFQLISSRSIFDIETNKRVYTADDYLYDIEDLIKNITPEGIPHLAKPGETLVLMDDFVDFFEACPAIQKEDIKYLLADNNATLFQTLPLAVQLELSKQYHPNQLARIMENLPPDNQVAILATLSTEKQLTLLQEFSKPELVLTLISALPERQQATLYLTLIESLPNVDGPLVKGLLTDSKLIVLNNVIKNFPSKSSPVTKKIAINLLDTIATLPNDKIPQHHEAIVMLLADLGNIQETFTYALDKRFEPYCIEAGLLQEAKPVQRAPVGNATLHAKPQPTPAEQLAALPMLTHAIRKNKTLLKLGQYIASAMELNRYNRCNNKDKGKIVVSMLTDPAIVAVIDELHALKEATPKRDVMKEYPTVKACCPELMRRCNDSPNPARDAWMELSKGYTDSEQPVHELGQLFLQVVESKIDQDDFIKLTDYSQPTLTGQRK